MTINAKSCPKCSKCAERHKLYNYVLCGAARMREGLGEDNEMSESSEIAEFVGKYSRDINRIELSTVDGWKRIHGFIK